MSHEEQRLWLIRELLSEDPRYEGVRIPEDAQGQRDLLRALMNTRPPRPLRPLLLKVQDEYLAAERDIKGVVNADALPDVPGHPGLCIWQGDITRLRCDAIVNAANSALLGCFVPCHGCIDNAIHSAAGLGLREECARIMAAQGHEEPNGTAKLTGGYCLPAKHVLHTVGPIIYDGVTDRDRQELASCYRACLDLAAEHGLESVAFCCISTGEFRFPNREAAEIAVAAVCDRLQKQTSIKKVIFNVFKDIDERIYHELLSAD